MSEIKREGDCSGLAYHKAADYIALATHEAEVGRLNNRIADLELELSQENASSRVYMDKVNAELTDKDEEIERQSKIINDYNVSLANANYKVLNLQDEIAALMAALKGAVVILEFSGNYNRMTDEDHALCERIFRDKLPLSNQ